MKNTELKILTYILITSLILNFNLSADFLPDNSIYNAIVSFSFIAFMQYFKLTRLILLAILITSALYLPTAMIAGVVSRGVLLAVLETDSREAIGFIKSIPLDYLILSFASLAISVLLFIYNEKYIYKINVKKSKIFFIFFLCTAITTSMISDKYNNYDPVIVRSAVGLKKLVREKKILDISNLKEPSWDITEQQTSKYNTFVVIIGESLRKDALPMYGLPIDTTPFISKIPKKFITDYYSTAINTSLAVPRILALTNENGVVFEENNAITLAKQAGYTTHWISSQGFTGPNNRTAARIAQFADNIHFEKKFVSDFKLLPKINEAIKSKGNNIIFIHTTGSHEDPCGLLDDFGIKHEIPNQPTLSCYLSTVQKTDVFLEKIYQELNKNKKNFSIVYTSDHGLSMKKMINGSIGILRDENLLESYSVPFFVISSDQLTNEKHVRTRDGYRFIDFFANWINVKTKQTIIDYNIFTAPDDEPLVMGYDGKKSPIKDKKTGFDLKEFLEN